MSFDEDPEVVADLRLRAATERDSSRSREMPVYAPAKVIDRVPCRNRCGSVVSWTEEAEQTFQTFNRQLARRAEAPLDITRILFCPSCEAAGRKARAAALPEFHAKIAEAIRELKAGCDDARQRELLEKLKKAGHPDVAGLEQWLRDQANGKHGKRVTRGAL